MMMVLRRSTVLADVLPPPGQPRVGGAPWARVGVDTGTLSHRCVDDQGGLRADVKQELLQRLKNYMQGFMNDGSRTDGLGRASWPDKDGKPTDAWNSPAAHRAFFESRAGGPGGKINADGMRSILSDIGMDQSVCSTSVADGLVHAMDKGGDDNATTWAEYLNSIFAIGPVSDAGTPDPTEAASRMFVTLPTSPKASEPAAPSSPAKPGERFAGFRRLSNVATPVERADVTKAKVSRVKIALGLGAVGAAVFAIVRFL